MHLRVFRDQVGIQVYLTFSAAACLSSQLALGKDIEIWEGDRAVLPCHVTGNHTDIQWCKEHNGACQNVATKMTNNQQFPEHPWTKKDIEILNNASLDIFAVKYPRDNGSFWCQSDKNYALNLHVLRK